MTGAAPPSPDAATTVTFDTALDGTPRKHVVARVPRDALLASDDEDSNNKGNCMAVDGDGDDKDKEATAAKLASVAVAASAGDGVPASAAAVALAAQAVRVAYVGDALLFARQAAHVIATAAQLLSSKTPTDVTEAVRFFVACQQFGVEGASLGVRKMLALAWAKEPSAKDALLEAFDELCVVGGFFFRRQARERPTEGAAH